MNRLIGDPNEYNPLRADTWKNKFFQDYFKGVISIRQHNNLCPTICTARRYIRRAVLRLIIFYKISAGAFFLRAPINASNAFTKQKITMV